MARSPPLRRRRSPLLVLVGSIAFILGGLVATTSLLGSFPTTSKSAAQRTTTVPPTWPSSAPVVTTAKVTSTSAPTTVAALPSPSPVPATRPPAPPPRSDSARVTLWFVRHGEAEHNLPRVDCWNPSTAPRDPPLTRKGLAQAHSTGRELLPVMGLPDLVYASPLRRTVQTVLGVLGSRRLIRDVRRDVQLHQHLQEVNNNECDRGRNHDEFGSWARDAAFVLNSKLLPRDYFNKPFSTDEGRESYVRERNAILLDELRATFKRNSTIRTVLLVAHYGTLQYLLNDTKFRNAEAREYTWYPHDPNANLEPTGRFVLPKMPKLVQPRRPVTLWFVRHGQAESNVPGNDCFDPQTAIRDPPLTELGQSQARELSVRSRDLPKPDLVMSSPLRRAVQTALAAFPSAAQIRLEPMLQEVNTNPCDTGREVGELLNDLPQGRRKQLDVSALHPRWYVKPYKGDSAKPAYLRVRTATWMGDLRSQLLLPAFANVTRVAIVAHHGTLKELAKVESDHATAYEFTWDVLDPIAGWKPTGVVI